MCTLSSRRWSQSLTQKKVPGDGLELSKIPYTLSEGLYVVGSGSTGVAQALGIMGAAYFTTTLLASATIKVPHSSFTPPCNKTRH